MKVYNNIKEVNLEELKKTEVICVNGTLKIIKYGKIENLKVVAK